MLHHLTGYGTPAVYRSRLVLIALPQPPPLIGSTLLAHSTPLSSVAPGEVTTSRRVARGGVFPARATTRRVVLRFYFVRVV